jgi:GR25 family glycosyltransferase involved in LPS biosynthesis
MIFNKIIYINLDRRPERNLNVIDQLKKVGLLNMAERFSAIDGKKLDLNKIDSSIITTDGIGYAKKSDIIFTHLTPGAIGCAMSHRAIYQKIIDENIENCLILEDDITFVDDFNKKIQKVEKYIKDNKLEYDLFFLGYHPSSLRDFYTQKFLNIYGLFGYIVNKNGAKKLLDLFPITYQIDTEISFNSDKINIQGVQFYDKIILSDQSQYSYKFGTDIQVKNNHTSENNKKSNHIIIFITIIIILCVFIICKYYI